MKIPIKKYIMDGSLSWEDRYKQLEKHHEEETTYLIAQLKVKNEVLELFLNKTTVVDETDPCWADFHTKLVAALSPHPSIPAQDSGKVDT